MTAYDRCPGKLWARYPSQVAIMQLGLSLVRMLRSPSPGGQSSSGIDRVFGSMRYVEHEFAELETVSQKVTCSRTD